MKIFYELQRSLQVTRLEHRLKLRIERLTKERRASSKVTKLTLQSQTQKKLREHTSQWKVTNTCNAIMQKIKAGEVTGIKK